MSWLENELKIIEQEGNVIEEFSSKLLANTPIEDISKYSDAVIRKYFEYIFRAVHKVPLTPILLKSEEFIQNTEKELTVYIHNRCEDIFKFDSSHIIIKDGSTDIINGMAWGYNVKHTYKADTNEEIVSSNAIIYHTFPLRGDYLWITKGGAMTGEYINWCYIKAKEERYVVREPINIPVSIIIDNNKTFITVDSREPKLKALKEFYNCSSQIDNNKLYDIRRFKKLW